MPLLPTYTATRYLQPLREGGSLPAVADTDGGRFVVKFRGAGQGARALISEVIVGLLARELELATPELAIIDVPPLFGRSEPDPEIQDLLRASHGTNIGLRYLDGAFNFSLQAARELVTADFAARVVWLDAFTTNPDRTHHNPNILLWDRQPWLIDHGAALFVHHDWPGVDTARTRSDFPHIRNHLLLDVAGDLERADAHCTERLNAYVFADILKSVPDALLMDSVSAGGFSDADTARARYVEYLSERIRAPRTFVPAAIAAQTQRRYEQSRPLKARR